MSKNHSLNRFVGTVLAFLALVFVLDKAGAYLLDKLYMAGSANPIVYAFARSNEDIIILGSSRAKHHYNSQTISDSTGLSCFNAGMDGQNIYYHYAVLEMILARHKPKVVIYELIDIDLQRTAEKYDKGQLNSLYPFYFHNDSVRQIVGLQGWKIGRILDFCRLYAYNSQLLSILKNLRNCGEVPPNAGYNPIDGVWNKPLGKEDSTPSEVDLEKISYVKRLIERCKRGNVKLFIAISPKYEIEDQARRQSIYAPVLELAVNNGVEFWNYEQDPFFLSDSSCFKDVLHLNKKGAAIFTSQFVQKLKSHIKK